MMDTVSKWKSKSQKTQISTDSAVANYSALPGYLKKAAAKKQRSGRASGQDNFADREETRACLACKKVGHLVKDCRDRSAKESWLSNVRRWTIQNKITTSRATESMKDNLAKEVSRQREAIRAIARTVEKEKITKKSKSVKTNNNWMNSNGEDLSGGSWRRRDLIRRTWLD